MARAGRLGSCSPCTRALFFLPSWYILFFWLGWLVHCVLVVCPGDVSQIDEEAVSRSKVQDRIKKVNEEAHKAYEAEIKR